jgi:hypothetical protein
MSKTYGMTPLTQGLLRLIPHLWTHDREGL